MIEIIETVGFSTIGHVKATSNNASQDQGLNHCSSSTSISNTWTNCISRRLSVNHRRAIR